MQQQTTVRSVSDRQSVLGMNPSQLAAQIKPSQVFQPEERETYLRLSHGDERVAISTNQKGFAQRIVRHEAFDVDRVIVNSSGQRLSTPSPPLSGLSGPVVRVEGQLPVNHLKVLKNGRGQSTHSHIVTDEVY